MKSLLPKASIKTQSGLKSGAGAAIGGSVESRSLLPTALTQDSHFQLNSTDSDLATTCSASQVVPSVYTRTIDCTGILRVRRDDVHRLLGSSTTAILTQHTEAGVLRTSCMNKSLSTKLASKDHVQTQIRPQVVRKWTMTLLSRLTRP